MVTLYVFFCAYLYSYFVVHSFLSQTVLHSRTSLHSLFLPSIDLTLAHVGKDEALLLGPSILPKTVFASIVFSISVKHFMSAVFYLRILTIFSLCGTLGGWLMCACLLSSDDWGETEFERSTNSDQPITTHGPSAQVTETERFNETDRKFHHIKMTQFFGVSVSGNCSMMDSNADVVWINQMLIQILIPIQGE